MPDLTEREQLIQLSTKMDALIENQSEMKESIKDLNVKFDEVDNNNEKRYVTKTEFDPIKRIVYGAVGLVLTTVLIALLGLIVYTVP